MGTWALASSAQPHMNPCCCVSARESISKMPQARSPPCRCAFQARPSGKGRRGQAGTQADGAIGPARHAIDATAVLSWAGGVPSVPSRGCGDGTAKQVDGGPSEMGPYTSQRATLAAPGRAGGDGPCSHPAARTRRPADLPAPWH